MTSHHSSNQIEVPLTGISAFSMGLTMGNRQKNQAEERLNNEFTVPIRVAGLDDDGFQKPIPRTNSKRALDESHRANISMPNLSYNSNGLKRSKSSLNKMQHNHSRSSLIGRSGTKSRSKVSNRFGLSRKSSSSMHRFHDSFSAVRHVHSGSMLSASGSVGGANASFDVVPENSNVVSSNQTFPTIDFGASANDASSAAMFENLNQQRNQNPFLKLLSQSQQTQAASSSCAQTITQSLVSQYLALSQSRPSLGSGVSMTDSSTASVSSKQEGSQESIFSSSIEHPVVSKSLSPLLASSNLSNSTHSAPQSTVRSQHLTKPLAAPLTQNTESSSATLDVNPLKTLVSLLQEAGYEAGIRKYDSPNMKDFFSPFTDKHVSAYTQDVVTAVRKGNLAVIKELHASGVQLHCANRYGESLVHMACRRGHVDVLRFLIEEVKCPLRVKDDFGRNPLHDALWSSEPNLELLEFLIDHDVDLFLIEDKRGHSPFSYIRRNHWTQWTNFLLERKEKLKLKTFIEPLATGQFLIQG